MTSNLTVVPLPPDDDPLGTLYRRVRDAARMSEGVTMADRVAVLELVKAEMVTEMLEAIHG